MPLESIDRTAQSSASRPLALQRGRPSARDAVGAQAALKLKQEHSNGRFFVELLSMHVAAAPRRGWPCFRSRPAGWRIAVAQLQFMRAQ